MSKIIKGKIGSFRFYILIVRMLFLLINLLTYLLTYSMKNSKLSFAMSVGSIPHFIENLFLSPADSRPQALTQRYSQSASPLTIYHF